VFNTILFVASSSADVPNNNLEITVAGNTTNFVVLAAAQALGFNNALTTDRTITLTINAGVQMSGTHGFQTGALQQNTTLAVINNGSIYGGEGATGSGGGNGGAGSTAVVYSTVTGGSATHSWINNHSIFGGRGGGGSAGRTTTEINDGDGTSECQLPTKTGTAGAVGAFGGTGGTGSFSGGSTSNDIADCTVFTPGTGGAGGAAIQWQGRTVSFTNNGAVSGSIIA
tara:strand:+ start:821 stop:1501 length:681 start_codon:yes stop_codon:yes gene_type:complete